MAAKGEARHVLAELEARSASFDGLSAQAPDGSVGQSPQAPGSSAGQSSQAPANTSDGSLQEALAGLRLRGANPLRLGIMGGTFDPIHVGHLILAEQVADALSLDRILFIPTGNPSFKRDKLVRPAADRLRMVELAIEDNPRFLASDMEVVREGVTYTLDTLRELHTLLPDTAELFFIMGSDTLLTLDHWRASEELAKLACFVGVNRPGDSLASEDDLARLRALGFDVVLLEAPALEVSSSDIRQRLESGRSVRYLVPDSVIQYAEKKRLYS